ncbi:acylphosphatase [Nocardioides bizhenqiangii]|uniref:acylphosphatase n=1 Tax=Nocardioides bizhenqiangii TaxID=3095076 RepID=A0ABZ0ZK62_9ACTN|nr:MULTISPECIES: acylphosphatase [unclassified Nocardioides]MDZ5620449.1 acylphosphatase [Nocardioides sp. HM23]WQQ24817.1 acylphosphatase [Nocardioides sp. HM61]
MEPRAVEVRVVGLVQGVFFRARCADQAARLGVRGWIRNENDGSVRGHFEGTAEAVEELVGWCHTGSPRASVDRVDVRDVDPDGAAGFSTD